jgi:4-amino-4-deoxy-L-arabinose transferase-like glycosyltransferase
MLRRERLPAFNQAIFTGLLCVGGAGLVLLNWHTPVNADTTHAATERFWILVGIGLWTAAAAINWRAIQPRLFHVGLPQHGIGLLTLALPGVYALVWLTLRLNPGWNVLGLHIADPKTAIPGRDQQMLLMIGGSALFVVGMMRANDIPNIGSSLRASMRGNWREWLLVIGLTAAALAVRFYKLDSLIPIIQSDESQFYQPARLIADGQRINMAANMQTDQTYLGAFIISYGVDLFGPTLFACRAITALTGALAIPGVYLMARRLFNPLAATLAALFLIGQPVHVYFSRTAIYQPFDPTIGIYTALLLWSGLECGERWKFALAGILIGLNQYFYTAGRLWLIIVPLWLLILLLRQPRALLRHGVNLLALSAGAVVIMLPLLAQVDRGAVSLTRRGVEMSHGNGDSRQLLDVTPSDYIFEWLSPAVRPFLDWGDESMHYEMNNHTALNLRLAFLVFGLGVAYALRFALNPRVLLVLIWIGLTVVFGGSLLHYIGATRYVTALLPMTVLGGVGVAWVAAIGQKQFPAYKPVAVLAALALMLAVTVQNLTFILDKHPKRLMDELWPERWIADSLVSATLDVPHDDNSVIYWLTASTAWNLRMEEIYSYYHGTLDYVEWNRPVTWWWLSTLDANQKDLYIFVPPVHGDSPDATAYPAFNSPINLILRAFPTAQVYRYDGRVYPTSKPPALYALVRVPRGSTNRALWLKKKPQLLLE